MLQIADDDPFGEIEQDRLEPALLIRSLLLCLSQCLCSLDLDVRQSGPYRFDPLGESPQPVPRPMPEAMCRILPGDNLNIESKAIERPSQAVKQQPSKSREYRKQRAARNCNQLERGFAKAKRKRCKAGGERYRKGNEQEYNNSRYAWRLLARHAQLRRSSIQRIRSRRSRVEKGFVTYSSAPSESPFSR